MYFLIKSKAQINTPEGDVKIIPEQHVFAAISWTDAETRFFTEFEKEGPNKERTIVAINPIRLSDILGDFGSDSWFKVKYHYLSETDSGKEKKIVNTMLVNAENLEHARKISEDGFSTWLIDCHIDSIIQTQILDVFPYKSEEEEIPSSLRPLSEVMAERELKD